MLAYLFGTLVVSRVEEIATYHDPGAAFAGLAMNDGHVSLVFGEILLDFLAKGSMEEISNLIRASLKPHHGHNGVYLMLPKLGGWWSSKGWHVTLL